MFLLYFIRASERALDDPALSTDLVVQPWRLISGREMVPFAMLGDTGLH